MPGPANNWSQAKGPIEKKRSEKALLSRKPATAPTLRAAWRPGNSSDSIKAFPAKISDHEESLPKTQIKWKQDTWIVAGPPQAG